MTETAQDRSKRTYLSHLLSNEWNHQLSIFFDPEEFDEDYFFSVGEEVRELCRKRFGDCSFLWRIQVKYLSTYNKGPMPYWTCFAYGSDDDIEQLANRLAGKGLNSRYRKVSREKVQSAASNVKAQKPHNLKPHFSRKKVNRFHLLNTKSLVSHNPSTTS